MGVSVFSVAFSVIFFNLSVLPVIFLGRNTGFLVKYRINVLFLFAGLSLVRLVTPVDHAYALILQSYYLLPHLIAFLAIPLKGAFTIGQLLISIWLLGSLAFFFRDLRQACQEIKRLKSFRPVTDLQAQTLLQKLCPKAKLTVSSDVDVPKVSGIIRPHIYLPVLKLSDQELAWVLNHELQHFYHHDLLIKMFYLLLVCVFWWNPLLHIFRRELDHLLELRCDASLTSCADQAGKLLYLQTILKVMRHTYLRDKSLYTSALLKSGRKGFIHQRFAVMTQFLTRPCAMKRFYALAVALFALSYFVIIQPAYEAPGAEGYIDFTPQNTYLVPAANGRYAVYYHGELMGSIPEKDFEYTTVLSAVPVKNEEN